MSRRVTTLSSSLRDPDLPDALSHCALFLLVHVYATNEHSTTATARPTRMYSMLSDSMNVIKLSPFLVWPLELVSLSSLVLVVVVSGADVVRVMVGAADVNVDIVGKPVGAVASVVVGVSECAEEGSEVGNIVGCIAGATDMLGWGDGAVVGAPDGNGVGNSVGTVIGPNVGKDVGSASCNPVGLAVGVCADVSEGDEDGIVVGA